MMTWPSIILIKAKLAPHHYIHDAIIGPAGAGKEEQKGPDGKTGISRV